MKWIKASDLDIWSKTNAARSELPSLVADLIRATAKEIQSFRFLGGDKSQVRGFDGWLEATGVPPHVPNGLSFWEFGVGAGKTKATADYKKRTDDVAEAERKTASLVLVSPSTWDDPKNLLQDYVSELRNKGDWMDVRFIDGVQLEDWLSACPGVAASYASVLGLKPLTGVRSTREFWDEYASRFRTPLTEDVLLSGRNERASELLERLVIQQPGSIELAADSPDEAIAFAIAAIRKSDVGTRAYLEDRTIIVDSEEAARFFSGTPNIIYLPRAQADFLSGLLSTKGPTLISKGRDQIGAKGRYLSRPSTAEFANSLKTMGFNDVEAQARAIATNRSITVLARQYPGGNVSIPQWRAQGRLLIPALLAGSWDESNDADGEALRLLIPNREYSELENQLRQVSKLQDPPVDREGSIWALRAPVDAFVNLGYLLSRGDLERLREVSIAVFSGPDPSSEVSDLENSDSPYVPSQSTRRNSGWLRDGLATTLLLIATLNEQAEIQITGINPQVWVDGIISALPALSADYRRMASLRGEFATLIEAAPRPLLSALEQLLEGDGHAALGFFSRNEGLFAPTSPHTYILWGLEVLAWDPEYLSRVTTILAKMATIDPGGQTTNRPVNSLRSILLAWSPGTNASLVERKRILEQIVRDFSVVGWELLLLLLPRNHGDTNIQTSKPKFREASSSSAEILTRGKVREFRDYVIDLTLTATGDDPTRWIEVIKRMESWPEARRAIAMTMLEKWMSLTAADKRNSVWLALQEVYNRHSTFEEANWAMPTSELARIGETLGRFEPSDIVARLGWLFDQWSPLMVGRYEDNEHQLVKARREALRPVLLADNLEELLRLVKSVGEPGTVAFAVAEELRTIGEFRRVLEFTLKRASPKEMQFAKVLSAKGADRFGEAWREYVSWISHSNLATDEQVAQLVIAWPDIQETWDYVTKLGDTITKAYWTQKYPLGLTESSGQPLQAIQNYLAVGRASAAIASTHRIVSSLSTSTIANMLNVFLNEATHGSQIPSQMIGYYVERLFNELDGRLDISLPELAGLEYAYLPIFERKGRTLAIHKMMAANPTFYFSLVESVFSPASKDQTEEEQATPEKRAKWRLDYRLLSEFETLPGEKNAEVDFQQLERWVLAVREFGKSKDRADIADIYIGHILAHAPAREDGVWPHISVSKLVDSLRAPEIEKGIRNERFNMRGVYTKALYEGGAQERKLAAQYRFWARETANYPAMSNLLNKIAGEWESDGAREDSRAEMDKLKG